MSADSDPKRSGDAPTVRMGDPSGAYRRRVRLVTLDPSTVWGGLEDDFHHFEVTLHHDGTHVTALEMQAVRWPWATCPDAGQGLQALVGMELSDRSTAVAAVTDPRMNCTHQFDLAGLCVADLGLLDERVQVVLLQAVDRRQSLELREFDLLGHRRAGVPGAESPSARESSMRAPVEVPTRSRPAAHPGPTIVRRESCPIFVC